jgi:monothiol glutaredoxin
MTLAKIKEQIQTNPILIYIKGTPNQPQCGFSAQAIAALKACGAEFAYVNILDNPDVRQELPKYANWPTFPQLYLKGELVGGCDIMLELYQNGELQQMVKDAVQKPGPVDN